MSQISQESSKGGGSEFYAPDERIFTELFSDGRLGEETERSHGLYMAYGVNLQTDVLNVLLHARDKNKIIPVLERLEEHLGSHLVYQHPEIRGLVEDVFGINETTVFFRDVCVNTLELTPNEEKISN